ncbi:hypothetical protein AMTR_s00003p00219130, partial [Amborella trichopoda]
MVLYSLETRYGGYDDPQVYDDEEMEVLEKGGYTKTRRSGGRGLRRGKEGKGKR